MSCDSFVSLMYHNIIPKTVTGVDESWLRRLSPSITNYFVNVDSFAQQIQLLAESADCLDGNGVGDIFHHREPPTRTSTTRPRVNITFDDGWQGCVTHGGPVLEQLGWKATVFVTTDLIDRPGFLTRGELRQLPASVFDVGSHAVTHGFLNEQSETSIRRELSDSRARLEDLLGRPVRSISIPNGAVDGRVREIAVEVGYHLLFTSDTHLNSLRTGPLHIGRVPVRHNTSPRQIVEFGRGQVGRQSWRRSLLQIPRRLLGPRCYRSVRRTLLGERKDQLEMDQLAAVPAEGNACQDDRDIPPRTQSFVPPMRSN